jgi:hypothetical protein
LLFATSWTAARDGADVPAPQQDLVGEENAGYPWFASSAAAQIAARGQRMQASPVDNETLVG